MLRFLWMNSLNLSSVMEKKEPSFKIDIHNIYLNWVFSPPMLRNQKAGELKFYFSKTSQVIKVTGFRRGTFSKKASATFSQGSKKKSGIAAEDPPANQNREGWMQTSRQGDGNEVSSSRKASRRAHGRALGAPPPASQPNPARLPRARPALRAAGKRHPPARRTRAPRRRPRAEAQAALQRHPAARGEACSGARSAPAAAPAAQPAPLSGCTRPSPRTKNTKWLPAAPSRDLFVPFRLPNSAGPGAKGPGSAGGLRGGPAGPRRPGLEAGGGGIKARPATGSRGEEKMAAILCGRQPAAAAGSRGSGPGGGRTGELTRTDSSSFSIPVGICGTARLIEAYSCRSGRSSQRNTGSGFEASSARARNDSLLISGAADPSPLWGNGPGQRDHGEPGVRSPLACRCRGLEGRSAEPAVRALPAAGGWEAVPRRSSLARSLQYAMANMADIKTPLCALQPTPAIPHTASRSGAGTRGGRGLEAGRRHGARVPPTPGARRPAARASPPPPPCRPEGGRAGRGGPRARTRAPGRPPLPAALPLARSRPAPSCRRGAAAPRAPAARQASAERGGPAPVSRRGRPARDWGALRTRADAAGGAELRVRSSEGKCRRNRGRGLLWVNFYRQLFLRVMDRLRNKCSVPSHPLGSGHSAPK